VSSNPKIEFQAFKPLWIGIIIVVLNASNPKIEFQAFKLLIFSSIGH